MPFFIKIKSMQKLSKEDIYQRLSNTEDARACKAIDEAACKVVPGNFLTLLVSQLPYKECCFQIRYWPYMALYQTAI